MSVAFKFLIENNKTYDSSRQKHIAFDFLWVPYRTRANEIMRPKPSDTGRSRFRVSIASSGKNSVPCSSNVPQSFRNCSSAYFSSLFHPPLRLQHSSIVMQEDLNVVSAVVKARKRAHRLIKRIAKALDQKTTPTISSDEVLDVCSQHTTRNCTIFCDWANSYSSIHWRLCVAVLVVYWRAPMGYEDHQRPTEGRNF